MTDKNYMNELNEKLKKYSNDKKKTKDDKNDLVSKFNELYICLVTNIDNKDEYEYFYNMYRNEEFDLLNSHNGKKVLAKMNKKLNHSFGILPLDKFNNNDYDKLEEIYVEMDIDDEDSDEDSDLDEDYEPTEEELIIDIQDEIVEQFTKKIEKQPKLLQFFANLDNDEDMDVDDDEKVLSEMKKYIDKSVENKEERVKLYEEFQKIHNYGKSLLPDDLKILKMDIPIQVKFEVFEKLESLDKNSMSGHDDNKTRDWINQVLKIPFGKFCEKPKIENLDKFLSDFKGNLDKAIYGQQKVKESLIEIITKWLLSSSKKGHCIAIEGPPGVGKCHTLNTPILMYDGSIKMVQDIKEGELLMGDDSKPRKVLALGRGKDNLYEISNIKGDKYGCNSEHILCLKSSKNPRIRDRQEKSSYQVIWFNTEEVKYNYQTFSYKNKNKEVEYKKAKEFMNKIDTNKNVTISVKDFLKLPKHIQNTLKGYKMGIEFPEKELDLDPYILGLWLGDGTSSKPEITNQDAPILKYLKENVGKYECYLSHCQDYTYRIMSSRNNKENKFLTILRNLNLINNKHIPKNYKCNSRENRLKLLAGLIDSDGYYSSSSNLYTIVQKNNKLTQDIVYLSRSLGFACYTKKQNKNCYYKEVKKEGIYNYIIIYGDKLNEIPTLCKRKQSVERIQIKDALVSGITIKSLGYDNYYGFELDGNHKYLLGNFIVTHNTSLVRDGLSKALKRPFCSFSLAGASDENYLSGFSFTYEGATCGRFAKMVMETGCMNPIIFLDELDKVDTNKSLSVFNKLIEVTDFSQNSEIEDYYFGSNIKFDLSQCIFIFSLNDINNVDPILKDRLEIIKVDGFQKEDKLKIAKDYLIPRELSNYDVKINFSDDNIKYMISKISNEKGVRNLKRSIEILMRKINVLRYFNNEQISYYMKDFKIIDGVLNINNKFIDKLLKDDFKKIDPVILRMYM